MQGERYWTVRAVVEKAGDWGTMAMLVDEGIGQQLHNLELLFSVAVSRHDDQAGQKFAAWIFHVLDDAELAPHLKEDSHGKYFEHSAEVEEARQRAMRARSEKVIALWPKVPAYAKTRGDGDYRPSQAIPTLLGTKKVMLTEVANRWRSTRDEAEADHLFGFLADLKPHVGFEEERKMIQGVIREATNHFPAERLACHIVAVTSAADSELTRLLTIAWARNVDFTTLWLKFTAVEPLAGCSPAAYEVARSFSAQVAKLDQDALFLKAVLGEREFLAKIQRPPEYEEVPGALKIAYKSHDTIEARLEIRLHWRTAFDENQGHEWFDAAKRNVRRWQVERPHPVNLEMVVMQGDREEAIFSREQQLVPKGARIAS